MDFHLHPVLLHGRLGKSTTSLSLLGFPWGKWNSIQDSMGKWNSIHRKYRTFVDSGDDLDLSVLTLDRCGTFVSQNCWDDEPKMDLGWLRYDDMSMNHKKDVFFWQMTGNSKKNGVSHAWCMTWTSFPWTFSWKDAQIEKHFWCLGAG